MNEMTKLVKMKPIEDLVLQSNPNGTWSFVGNVPVNLYFVDPTPEKIRAAKIAGDAFGPKRRVFKTRNEAIEAAREENVLIDQITQ